MTTRKDVEEALGWFRSMFKRMYIPCKVLEVIEQALKEKLNRFDTIGTVEYVQELEKIEKSDEE